MKRLTLLFASLALSGCNFPAPPAANPAIAGAPAQGQGPAVDTNHDGPPASNPTPTKAGNTPPGNPPASNSAPSTPTNAGGGGSGATQQTGGSLTLTSGNQVSNTWAAGPSLQHPRAGLNVMAWGGVLLALEGDNRPSLEKLTANGQWQLDLSYDITAPTDPSNLGNSFANGSWLSALTSDATSVITAGGDMGTSSPYILRYGSSGFISAKNALGAGARAAAAIASNGVLYIAGGLDDNGAVQTLVQGINLQSYTASAVGNMPTGVAGAASATLNGKLYVFGGYTLDSSGNPVAQSLVQVYDPQSNTWRTSSDGLPGAPAPLPAARHSGAAAVLNGDAYLTGGMNASGTLMSDLQIYDPTANRWSSGAAMPTPRALLGLGAFNGQLWAVGGVNAAKVALTTVEVYQP